MSPCYCVRIKVHNKNTEFSKKRRYMTTSGLTLFTLYRQENTVFTNGSGTAI